jgi:hypothetical protein
MRRMRRKKMNDDVKKKKRKLSNNLRMIFKLSETLLIIFDSSFPVLSESICMELLPAKTV